jgi:adenylosuccinate lyase
VSARLAAELPFLATEEIMLAAVARGADRQDAHEAIRRHAQAAAHRIKAEGAPNDLLSRLKGDSMFSGCDLDAVVDPDRYIGLAVAQTEAFLREIAAPVRARYAQALAQEPELRV